MYKIIIVFIFIIFSCTQYTAVNPVKPEYDLVLNNNILNIDLYEIKRIVYLKNIGNQLIIEIDYNVGDENIIIYDTIVPGQEVYIYAWPERMNYDVIITLNSIILY